MINIIFDILINVKMFPKRNILLKDDHYFKIFQNKIRKNKKKKKIKRYNSNIINFINSYIRQLNTLTI